MKKFLVFMLVVSMVAFAGCAFADGDNVDHPSTSPTTDTTNGGAAFNELSSTQQQELISNVATAYSSVINLLKQAATRVYSLTVGLLNSISTTDKQSAEAAMGGTFVSSDQLVAPNADNAANAFTRYTAQKLAQDKKAGKSTQSETKGFVPSTIKPNNRFKTQATASYDKYIIPMSSEDVKALKDFGPDSLVLFPQLSDLTLMPEKADDMKLVYMSADQSADLTVSVLKNTWTTDKQVYLVVNYNAEHKYGGVGTSAATSPDVDEIQPIVIAVKDAGTIAVEVPTADSWTETNTTPTGVGGSGGGCVAGTSALALAVLGLFIAKRRG